MIHRSRVVSALLAALLTLVVALPLEALFREATWVPLAAGGILVVSLTGILVRGAVDRPGITIAAQALSTTGYLLMTLLGDTTRYGVVPTRATLRLFLQHLRDARETITTYAAPAPETPGVTVALVLIVVVVALAVDLAAVTAGSPVIAGLPLLSLFLVSAANSSGSLPWGWFVAGALLWLALIAHQSDRELRAWTTSVPLLGRGHERDDDLQGLAERSLRWQAARLAVVGLAVAVLTPTLLPHLPTRYVLDGLGGGGAGTARTTDGIRLATELDLKRSLESPSQEPVLTYETDDPSPQPLRVAVVTDFADGFGRMRSDARQVESESTLPDPLVDVGDDVARVPRNLRVIANGVAAPQVALPNHLDAFDTGGIPWSVGDDGTGWVERTPISYGASYLELEPTAGDFRTDAAPFGGGPAVYSDEHLALDPASAEAIQELAASLTPDGADDLATAQSFQEYLRGPEFTYDLELPADEGLPEEPVLSFLESKVGYCQQFATTMTLLARASGIPARVVVGFLPGEASGDGERVIRASDAHAWPELYFEGVGWTRFEPTPGSRAAAVPRYSIASDEGGVGATQTSATASEPTTATTRTQPGVQDSQVDAADEAGGAGIDWSRWLITALVVLAALAVMPVTALVARRRERTHAVDDADRVEREWQDFIQQLEDLGVRPPEGATPRHVGEFVARRGHLEQPRKEQLGHVVATLERARYARPGQDLPDITEEVTAIVGDIRSQRMASTRLRARLWPRAGVDTWANLPARLSGALRRRT